MPVSRKSRTELVRKYFPKKDYKLVEKEIIVPGSYMVPYSKIGPDGKEVEELEEVEIPEERIDRWVENYDKMIAKGRFAPAPYRHDLSAQPVKVRNGKPDAADNDAANNAGYWAALRKRRDGKLVGLLAVPRGTEHEERVGKSVREVSLLAQPNVSFDGQQFDDAITHVALVTHPVVGGQMGENFREVYEDAPEGSVAIALSQFKSPLSLAYGRYVRGQGSNRMVRNTGNSSSISVDTKTGHVAHTAYMEVPTRIKKKARKGETQGQRARRILAHGRNGIKTPRRYSNHTDPAWRKTMAKSYWSQKKALGLSTFKEAQRLADQVLALSRFNYLALSSSGPATPADPSADGVPPVENPTSTNANAATVKDALEILAQLGLTLPDDTDAESLVERIVVAGQALIAQKGSEPTGPEAVKEAPSGSKTQPKGVAMSAAGIIDPTTFKDPTQKLAMEGIVKAGRGSYQTRIDEAVRTGRCTPEHAEKYLKPHMANLALSFDAEGRTVNSLMDALLAPIESLPAGHVLTGRSDMQVLALSAAGMGNLRTQKKPGEEADPNPEVAKTEELEAQLDEFNRNTGRTNYIPKSRRNKQS